MTLDDGMFNEEKTNIVSIKGLPIKEFKDKILVVFCRANHVKIANGRSSKANCVQQIIAKVQGTTLEDKIKESVKKKAIAKGTKPTCITKLGTYYRVILTLTLPSNREVYLRTTLYTTHERKISQEKYLTQLGKETFDLELEYEEIHRNDRRLKEELEECSSHSSDNRLTELNVLKKKRNLVKKHIVRNKNSIANMKKDLKIEDEDSSSDDSVF